MGRPKLNLSQQEKEERKARKRKQAAARTRKYYAKHKEDPGFKVRKAATDKKYSVKRPKIAEMHPDKAERLRATKNERQRRRRAEGKGVADLLPRGRIKRDPQQQVYSDTDPAGGDPSMHPDRLLYCPLCQRQYPRAAVASHVHLELRGASHNCAICVQGFLNEDRLMEHLLEHNHIINPLHHLDMDYKQGLLTLSEDVSHQCSACEEVFSQEDALLKHMIVCSTETVVAVSDLQRDYCPVKDETLLDDTHIEDDTLLDDTHIDEAENTLTLDFSEDKMEQSSPYEDNEFLLSPMVDSSPPSTPHEDHHVTPIEHPKSTPTDYTKPTPTDYTKPTPTDYTKPTPTDYIKSTPTDYTKPTPTNYIKSTPTDYTKSTPTNYTKSTPTNYTKSTPTNDTNSTPTEYPNSRPENAHCVKKVTQCFVCGGVEGRMSTKLHAISSPIGICTGLPDLVKNYLHVCADGHQICELCRDKLRTIDRKVAHMQALYKAKTDADEEAKKRSTNDSPLKQDDIFVNKAIIWDGRSRGARSYHKALPIGDPLQPSETNLISMPQSPAVKFKGGKLDHPYAGRDPNPVT